MDNGRWMLDKNEMSDIQRLWSNFNLWKSIF
jgi:hypothetical protein